MAHNRRDVLIKTGDKASLFGDTPGHAVWEADDDYGRLVRLDVNLFDEVFLTITDMENHDGAFESVKVRIEDLTRLRDYLNDHHQ